jgi:hypothetical protein
MTIRELRDTLHALGFISAHDILDGGRERLVIAKLATTPGHRLAKAPMQWPISEAGMRTIHLIDDPMPVIRLNADEIRFTASCGVPSSPGAYATSPGSLDEVLEEILHYFYDPDSRMTLEPGFEAATVPRPDGPTRS